MNKQSLKRFVSDPAFRYSVMGNRGLYNWVSDEKYLSRKYRLTLGRDLDLEHPTTFNEKLQWLKLHDRNPLYTTLVDKYAVKQWVTERVCLRRGRFAGRRYSLSRRTSALARGRS